VKKNLFYFSTEGRKGKDQMENKNGIVVKQNLGMSIKFSDSGLI